MHRETSSQKQHLNIIKNSINIIKADFFIFIGSDWYIIFFEPCVISNPFYANTLKKKENFRSILRLEIIATNI
jgi:hypothetical protein